MSNTTNRLLSVVLPVYDQCVYFMFKFLPVTLKLLGNYAIKMRIFLAVTGCAYAPCSPCLAAPMFYGSQA